MSVLIKGMEMPKKCEQCWFFGTDSARVGYCYLLKGELPLPDGVPQDCPLIEVPTPHGRLIDADALKEIEFCGLQADKKIIYQMGWNDAIDAIAENAPTIIESEGE